jgi:hypothetical protein
MRSSKLHARSTWLQKLVGPSCRSTLLSSLRERGVLHLLLQLHQTIKFAIGCRCHTKRRFDSIQFSFVHNIKFHAEEGREEKLG